MIAIVKRTNHKAGQARAMIRPFFFSIFHIGMRRNGDTKNICHSVARYQETPRHYMKGMVAYPVLGIVSELMPTEPGLFGNSKLFT